MTTADIIRPIITDIYGDNGMSRALVIYLADRIDKYAAEPCPRCNGDGDERVKLDELRGGGGPVGRRMDIACSACNGSGESDRDSRERMIMMTCWNWFPGGSTAESTAYKIEAALEARHGTA